jgi:hypothetical protein
LDANQSPLLAAYAQIANGLSTANILWTCTNVNFKKTNRAGTLVSYHPVSLARIGGKQNPNNRPSCVNAFESQGTQFSVSVADLGDTTEAWTLTIADPMTQANLAWQTKCTGSKTPWSDVTFSNALNNLVTSGVFTSPGQRFVTFQSWPSLQGKSSWLELEGFNDDTKGNFETNLAITETVFHELFHSIAVPDPEGKHPKHHISPQPSTIDVIREDNFG